MRKNFGRVSVLVKSIILWYVLAAVKAGWYKLLVISSRGFNASCALMIFFLYLLVWLVSHTGLWAQSWYQLLVAVLERLPEWYIEKDEEEPPIPRGQVDESIWIGALIPQYCREEGRFQRGKLCFHFLSSVVSSLLLFCTFLLWQFFYNIRCLKQSVSLMLMTSNLFYKQQVILHLTTLWRLTSNLTILS